MNRSSSSMSTADRPKAARSLWGLALGVITAAAGAFSASCAPDAMPFAEDEVHVFAGGIEVDGHALNLGYQSYTRYCYACHGEKGDGKGPASYSLRPSPRDFTKGIFKFARLRSSDDLPNDADLMRIVKGGLHGTAMLPWDIQEGELSRVLQYIKTFAPQRWEKKKKNGDPVKTLKALCGSPGAPEDDCESLPTDPWTGNAAEAVQLGRELYHLRAECLNCHPSYLGKKDLYDLSVAANKRDPDKFKVLGGYRADANGSVAKDSEEYAQRILPPDFTFNPVRSVKDEDRAADLFRVLAYGVYPIMPAWRDAGLTDKEIWAIAYYVKSLIELRGTPEAMKLRETWAAQAGFEPPKPVAEKPADPPADAAAEPDKDAKAGDAKAGDAKAGDKKAGDKKAGDKKEEKK